MFASYEVATSFPSLTAIKGYDLDKSSDVPLMGHKEIMECNLRCASFDFHLLIVNENFIIDAIAENQTCMSSWH